MQFLQILLLSFIFYLNVIKLLAFLEFFDKFTLRFIFQYKFLHFLLQLKILNNHQLNYSNMLKNKGQIKFYTLKIYSPGVKVIFFN